MNNKSSKLSSDLKSSSLNNDDKFVEMIQNENAPNSLNLTYLRTHCHSRRKKLFFFFFKTRHDDLKAVRIIEKAYCSYRDKQMFRLLKHAVCAAEHSLSKEILRKIAPLESNLLNDPIFKVKVKFRFSGPEYPPFIVFKIYTQTHDGRSAKYINGKNTIKPSSPAAHEACSQMGNRKYYDLMIVDSLQEQANGKIANPENVISLRDYMQYSSVIDDLPAYMGGRSNNWRRLNLIDLPRQTIFYDVLNYALTRKISSKLSRDLPILLQPPVNSEIQLAQIQIMSKLDLLPSGDSPVNPSSTYLNSSTFKSTISQVSSRRSRNALSKVLKMKKAYTNGMARSETLTTDVDAYRNMSAPVSEPFKLPEDLNDDFEKEVKNLYTWTQNLSINDDTYLNSPRLPQSALKN